MAILAISIFVSSSTTYAQAPPLGGSSNPNASAEDIFSPLDITIPGDINAPVSAAEGTNTLNTSSASDNTNDNANDNANQLSNDANTNNNISLSSSLSANPNANPANAANLQANNPNLVTTDTDISNSFSANIQNTPDTVLSLQYNNPPLRTCMVSTQPQNAGMDRAVYLFQGRANLKDWARSTHPQEIDFKVLNDIIPTDSITLDDGTKRIIGFLKTSGGGKDQIQFKIEQISTECLNTAWNTKSLSVLNSFGDSGIVDSEATVAGNVENTITDVRSSQFTQRNPPVRVCTQDPSGVQINNMFALATYKFEGQMDFTKLVDNENKLKTQTPLLIRVDNLLLRQNSFEGEFIVFPNEGKEFKIPMEIHQIQTMCQEVPFVNVPSATGQGTQSTT
jgi:hypothetical protein